MVFRIDGAGFDDRCVTGMTFWQLCTLENTPQHNALSSNTHIHTHNHKCRDFHASCRLLSHAVTRTFLGEHAATSLARFSLFFLPHKHTHTHTRDTQLSVVRYELCEADKG